MVPIDVNDIVERTLTLASNIECELYQCARHSSKLRVIEELRQWLKFGQKHGSFKYACTTDGKKNLRDLCYEVFEGIGFTDDLLAKNCITMVGLLDEVDRYAIRFNTDDDKVYEIDDYYTDEEGYIDRYLDKEGEIIVPYQQVLISVWRGKQGHVTVGYHTFFHAIRQYFLDKERSDLALNISQQFGLTDISNYYCDQLSVIPSVLEELTTEILFANRPKWREYYPRAQEITALINDRFHG